MELPTHPESAEEHSPPRQERPVDWTTVAVVAVIGGLLAVMVILHLTGVVGPGAHG
jgi:hypothetical protein